jgi:hypothetical protein
MPSYLRGQSRPDLVFVKVTRNNLFYGFKSKKLTAMESISEADVIALGHIKYQFLRSSSIPIVGANAPKPSRVKKQITRNPRANQQGSISTFCGLDNLNTAQSRGWEVMSLTIPVRPKNNEKTVTVGAIFYNAGIYLFAMNKLDAETYGLELGLALPHPLNSINFRNFGFTGSTKPHPPIVSKQTSKGKFTCFCSPIGLQDALTVHGYSLVKSEYQFYNPNEWRDEFGVISG